MSALQVVVLLLVAAGGTGVVLTREPSRQALVASFYGLLLTLLFVVFQAPDVALSELAVGTAAVPLMILLALSKTRTDARRADGKDRR
jgi:energy-converting hydrogenase B subunit D